MARHHARILTAIWSDPDFTTLLGYDQRLYIVTITQPNMNLCGVVQYSPRRWARLEAEGDPDQVQLGMERLTARRYTYVDADAEEVLARTFVRHDGVLRSPNSVIGMTRDYGGIQSPTLRELVIANLPIDFVEQIQKGRIDGYTKSLPKDFPDRLGQAFMNDLPKPLKPLGKGLPKPLSKPLPEGLGEGLPKPPDKGVLAGATPAHVPARASACTPPPPPPPVPPPPGATHPAAPDGARRRHEPAGSAGDEDDETTPTSSSANGRGGSRIPAGDATITADAPDRPATIDDVWTLLAHHDAEAWIADGGKIRNRRNWLRTAAENRQLAHGDDAATWAAAGMSPAQILDRIRSVDDQAGDTDGERRVDPVAAQELLDRIAAEEADRRHLDAEIDALPAEAFQDLHHRATAAAAADWHAPGSPPAPMVRAVMRTLHQTSSV